MDRFAFDGGFCYAIPEIINSFLKKTHLLTNSKCPLATTTCTHTWSNEIQSLPLCGSQSTRSHLTTSQYHWNAKCTTGIALVAQFVVVFCSLGKLETWLWDCSLVCVWGDHWVIALLCFDSFPCSNRWKFRALIVGKLAALLLLFSSPDRLVQTRIPWRWWWYLINRPIFRAERGSFERGYYSGNGGALDCRWNSSSGNGLHWNYLQTVGDDPGGWSWSRRFFWLACGEDLKWYN